MGNVGSTVRGVATAPAEDEIAVGIDAGHPPIAVEARAKRRVGGDPLIGGEILEQGPELFGVGALVDYAGGDLDSTIVAGVAFLHPYKGLVLLGAAGNENTHHGDEFLVRLGIGYDFELSGGWTLGPLLNFDFVEDEETKEMFGIVVGKHL